MTGPARVTPTSMDDGPGNWDNVPGTSSKTVGIYSGHPGAAVLPGLRDEKATSNDEVEFSRL